MASMLRRMRNCRFIIIIRPHRYAKHEMLSIAIDVAWSVVCLLDTSVSPAKTDEPIDMPFVLLTLVGPITTC